MAFLPIANLKGTLPTFAPGGKSAVPVVRLSPWLRFSVPLPQFNPANAGNLTFAGQRSFIPVKPLPGTGGGGGGPVGYPIDSG